MTSSAAIITKPKCALKIALTSPALNSYNLLEATILNYLYLSSLWLVIVIAISNSKSFK